jgi:fibronectin-binding autotransporter adhesin
MRGQRKGIPASSQFMKLRGIYKRQSRQIDKNTSHIPYDKSGERVHGVRWKQILGVRMIAICSFAGSCASRFKPTLPHRVGTTCLFVPLVLLLAGGLSHASTVTVCDEANLRAAIQNGGTVDFACDGTIVLTNEITISQDAILDANGHAVTISGNNAVRVFVVNSGINFSMIGLTVVQGTIVGGFAGALFNDGNVTLQNCIFSGHSSVGSEGGGGAAGAILNNFGSRLVASNCTISGNSAYTAHGGAVGGGIFNRGTLVLVNSTVSSNSAHSDQVNAGYGGGVENQGTLLATNCTFYANSAYSTAGGTGFGGGIRNGDGAVNLVNCTFSDNSAAGRGGAINNGVFGAGTNSGTLTLQNCIVANSLSGSNAVGIITDGGNNISSDGSCLFSASGSLNDTDSRLAPLGDYGGPTKTMALLDISPAIDAGNAAVCPATDQRGVPRPAGSACDIGAVEGAIPTSTPRFRQDFVPNQILEGESARLTFTLSNASGMTFSQVAFTNNLPPQIVIADPPGITNSCGTGNVEAIAGGHTLRAYGINLSANQTCTVAVNVTSSAHGIWTNPAIVLWSNETGPGRTASPASLTVAGKPVAITGNASNVTTNSARIHAMINPSGFDTSVYFDYGTSTNFGNRTVPQSLGNGFSDLQVQADLTGLLQSTGYYYQVVASNAHGIVYGGVRSFFTRGNLVITNCDQVSFLALIEGGETVSWNCDGTIVLTNTVTIAQDTTLDATGHAVTLSGNNSVRLFNVRPGVSLTLIHLTLANGRATGTNGAPGLNGEPISGGAILNNGGTVRLFDCTVTNNVALGGAGGNLSSPPFAGNGGNAAGGAIATLAGSLVISNCLIISNNVTGGLAGSAGPNPDYGDAGEARGGAIYTSNAQLIVIRTDLTANRAFGGDSGPGFPTSGAGGWGYGGGLFVHGGSADLVSVNLQGNAAMGDDSAFSGGPPGSAYGGAAYFTGGVVRLTSATFTTNVAIGGLAPRNNGAAGAARGGGVYSAATLEIRDNYFRDNRTSGGGGARVPGAPGQGGALYNEGTMVLNSCAVVNNFAVGGSGGFSQVLPPTQGGIGSGGGVYNAATLLTTNCTFALNSARGGPSGGGLTNGGDGVGGGIFHELGSSVLCSITLASNRAIGAPRITNMFFETPPGASLGGGIASSNSGVRLQNSILAFNTNGSNCFGVLTDDGNNISTDASCPFTAVGSLSNTDPVLSALDDFGGPTPTMALLAGSPAIDHALATFCPGTDQRGWPRPHGAGCDVGAFESGPPFSIRGRITGYIPPSGIPVYGGSTSTVSTASGVYTLWGLPAGTHTVVASSPTMIALPNSRTISVGPDALDVDFKSYRFNAFTVEGYTNDVAHLVFAGTNTLSYEVQTGTNLMDWTPISTNVVGADSVFHLFYTNGPMRFFRTLGR